MARHRKRPAKKLSCEGKKKLSEDEAIRLSMKLARTQGSIMNAYRCPHRCKRETGQVAWHVGHMTFVKL